MGCTGCITGGLDVRDQLGDAAVRTWRPGAVTERAKAGPASGWVSGRPGGVGVGLGGAGSMVGCHKAANQSACQGKDPLVPPFNLSFHPPRAPADPSVPIR